jgi:ATP-binding cassette subfamily F protein 3
VILITHDRSLMELVADRLWLAEGGTVKPFEGDMDDYARRVLERARAGARAADKPSKAPPAAVAAAPPPPSRPRLDPAPLRRKLEAAEQKLARVTAEAEKLSDPALLSDPAGEGARKLEAVQRRLAEAEAAWMEAAAALERAEAA